MCGELECYVLFSAIAFGIFAVVMIVRMILFLGALVFGREPVLCDNCFKRITNFKSDCYHHSGWLYGELNTHIHLCAKCQNRIKPPLFDFDSVAE